MKRRAPKANRRWPADVARDTEATAFTTLLAELIARVPGARAAALVDRDGESVDYAGALYPFDVKVAAAHLQIVKSELSRLAPLGAARHLVVRGTRRTFILRALADEYAVVLVLSARAGFAAASRAFLSFERALVHEAGIGRAPAGPPWEPIGVTNDARHRPEAISPSDGSVARRVEVLGTVMGLRAGERGYRIRLESGFETTIVREPGGAWYAEDGIVGLG